MVGGGEGAFIGGVHRAAMRLDGLWDLQAASLCSDPDRSLASAEAISIDRGYGTWQEMLDAEVGQLDCITVVTPNDSHAEIATAALDKGFHVMLDKPMTRTLAEAELLAAVAAESDRNLFVTYTYAGYPMVRKAAELVASGAIGAVRTVSAEYRQGWLATAVEKEGQKQASWRTDPSRSGAGALGEIGCHAEFMVRFVSGLAIEQVRGDVRTLIEGRSVDDHAAVQLRLTDDIPGDMVVSQVCTGERNDVNIRIWGDSGSIAWSHERCDQLVHTDADASQHILHRGDSRVPIGHPEGFVEAFANIYAEAAKCMRGTDARVPDYRDGLAGIQFIDAVLRSAESGQWVEV